MKIAHLADLHIGKMIFGYSLIDDQIYILDQIVQHCIQHDVDVVMLCGDIFDRSVPSATSIRVLNDFLTQLHDHHITVLMIAGNHDSPERIAYGQDLFAMAKIYPFGYFSGKIEPLIFQDQYGPIHFYPIPFLRLADINRYVETPFTQYTEAFAWLIQQMNLDSSIRNICLGHQFILGSSIDENGSEEMMVGGLDQIDAKIFSVFDYAAFGHIHRPQNIYANTIRYCGTPLAYSFAEENQVKSMPVITLEQKGQIQIELIPLVALRQMKTVVGRFEDLMSMGQSDDYVRIVLTDDHDIPDAIYDLRKHFPHLMRLEYQNVRTQYDQILNTPQIDQVSPLELIEQFYESQNNQSLSDEQKQYIQQIIQQVMEEQ